MTTMEDETYHEPRRLSPEELQKSVERLTRPTREPVRLGPVAPTTRISAEDLEKRIRHLYDESLERRAREREEIEQQMEAAAMKDATLATPANFTSADEENMVQRLYDETLERKQRTLEELEQQETQRYGRKPAMTKSHSEMKELTNKYYVEGMERERKKRIALYEQYVLSRYPEPKRRTKNQLANSSDKMARGESMAS